MLRPVESQAEDAIASAVSIIARAGVGAVFGMTADSDPKSWTVIRPLSGATPVVEDTPW